MTATERDPNANTKDDAMTATERDILATQTADDLEKAPCRHLDKGGDLVPAHCTVPFALNAQTNSYSTTGTV